MMKTFKNFLLEEFSPNEGDKVRIMYGQYNGKYGKVVQLAPSGKFSVIQVDNGPKISLDNSDIELSLDESISDKLKYKEEKKKLDDKFSKEEALLLKNNRAGKGGGLHSLGVWYDSELSKLKRKYGLTESNDNEELESNKRFKALDAEYERRKKEIYRPSVSATERLRKRKELDKWYDAESTKIWDSIHGLDEANETPYMKAKKAILDKARKEYAKLPPEQKDGFDMYVADNYGHELERLRNEKSKKLDESKYYENYYEQEDAEAAAILLNKYAKQRGDSPSNYEIIFDYKDNAYNVITTKRYKETSLFKNRNLYKHIKTIKV